MEPKLPPEFRPENRLEELLLTLGKTAEVTKEFYREFLTSDVITLGYPDPGSKVKEGIQRLQELTKVSFRLLQYQGNPVVPIYSSMARMTAVIPEEYYRKTGYIGLNCKTLLVMMMSSDPKSRFALNPGHMRVKVFVPEEVAALLDGTIFKKIEDDFTSGKPQEAYHIPKGTQVEVGRPSAIPTELADRLVDFFQSVGGVEQAFLGEMSIPTLGQSPHLVLCIRLREDSRRTFDQISDNIGSIVRLFMGKDEFLDIIDLKTRFAEMPTSKFIRLFPKQS